MVSEHGYFRANERMHLGRESAERYFRNALERGKSSSELTGLVKYYVHSKESEGFNVKLYNSNIYIFNDQGLGITVYPLPEYVVRKVMHRGKMIFKNISCYRNWMNYDEDYIVSAF